MDRHTQIRMFEPRLTTKRDKATGLGLTTVQQIVTLAGGFIEGERSGGRDARATVLPENCVVAPMAAVLTSAA